MRRRALLRSIGTVGTITALAGCANPEEAVDEGDGDGGDGIDETETTAAETETETETETQTEVELEVTEQSIETNNADCGEESDASIEFGDVVTITGNIRADNPCHEATFEDIRPIADVLDVTIGTEQVDEECDEDCPGTLEYTAEITTSTEPGSVVVAHLTEEEPEVVADSANDDGTDGEDTETGTETETETETEDDSA